MKNTSKLFLKALALVLSFSCLLTLLSGCGKNEDEWITSEIIIEEDDQTSDSSVSEDASSDSNVASGSTQSGTTSTGNKNAPPEKLKNPNITVFWPMTLTDHPEFTALNKAFEKKYGGKVTVVGEGDWDGRGTRFTNLVQSKSQVDLYIDYTAEDYPSYPSSNLIRPLDKSRFDFSQAPFVGADKLLLSKYNGELYSVSATNGSSLGVVTVYNKTLFENAGLKTPLELYKSGQWNWNTFREAARNLSQDTNGDGKNDIFGFADYDINGLLCSNGVSLLKYDGKNYSPDNSDAAKRAYQLYFDMINIDKSICGDPWSWRTDMIQGKLAMVFQSTALILEAKNSGSKFEYDFVPLPKGPDTDSYYKTSGGGGSFYAMGATCKNPEGAYAYIKFAAEYKSKMGLYDENEGTAKYTADQEKRLTEYSKLKTNEYSPTGFGNLKMDARSLLWEIRGGKSVGAVLEYWNNVLTQDIKIASASGK